MVATNLNWTPPNKLTVGQIQSLVAYFTWAQGNNHTGSMYWIINTPDGNVWAYYGDLSTTFQAGTGGTGTNLWGAGDARFEASQLGHSPQYDTLANILASPAPTAAYGTIAGEPVNWIGLAVDEGASGAQAVQLSTSNPAVDITTTAYGDATYTPGDVTSGGGATACASDTTDPMWISLAKVSSNTPAQPIDESAITDTQGDTGGQFRVANGFYMYNLPLSQLTDLTATYQLGISPNSDGSNPVGVVQFGLK